MQRGILVSAALLIASSSAAMAAAAPTTATIISNEDVQKVLKLGAKATDHTIRVMDMGQGYQMSVAVVHRGSTRNPPPRPAAANAPSPQPAAAWHRRPPARRWGRAAC